MNVLVDGTGWLVSLGLYCFSIFIVTPKKEYWSLAERLMLFLYL
jgi:hypothetical protein